MQNIAALWIAAVPSDTINLVGVTLASPDDPAADLVLQQNIVLASGDALVIPAGESFSLSNPGAEPFCALAVLPVGGKAILAGGEPFSPPWTV